MSTDRSRSTTRFAIVALLVALVLAGVVSFWASSSPDGLEKAAQDTGFADSAQDHDLADSPFADYGTSGLDGFAGSAVAGVAGVLVTLGVTGGLVLLVRRRSAAADDASRESAGSSTER